MYTLCQIFCVIFTVFWKTSLSAVSSFFPRCFWFVVSAFTCMFGIFKTYFTYYYYHYKIMYPWNVCMLIFCFLLCFTLFHQFHTLSRRVVFATHWNLVTDLWVRLCFHYLSLVKSISVHLPARVGHLNTWVLPLLDVTLSYPPSEPSHNFLLSVFHKYTSYRFRSMAPLTSASWRTIWKYVNHSKDTVYIDNRRQKFVPNSGERYLEPAITLFRKINCEGCGKKRSWFGFRNLHNLAGDTEESHDKIQSPYPVSQFSKSLLDSHSYLLTHSMVQDILWKADSHLACQTIAYFLYGKRRFITVFTKARH
jgi:hypothetical protein